MSGLPKMLRALIASVACIVIGCASTSSVTAPDRNSQLPELQVWLLPDCPSTFDHPHGWATGLSNLLVVRPAKALAHWLSRPPSPESQADRVMYGTAPGYLWWSDSSATPGVASCIVLAASDSDPATWCELPHSPFLEARGGAICEYFRSAKSSSAAVALSSAKWKGSGLPRFYAEILLRPAKDGDGVVPRGALYYYPAPLHSGKSDRGGKRSLLITVSATAAEGDDLALEDVVLPLTDIQPSDQLNPVPALPSVSTARPSKVQFIHTGQAARADRELMSVRVAGSVYESANPEPVLQLAATIVDSSN